MVNGSSEDTTLVQPLQVLHIANFEVVANLSAKSQRERRHSDAFEVAISVGRCGTDERGFVIEVHELMDRVKRSFHPWGELGPQPGRDQERHFGASCEQAAYGVARVVYDLLGEDLAETTVSVKTMTGLATCEWKKGDPVPAFPNLRNVAAKPSGDQPRWTRHFNAFNVTALLANNFRCGMPEGVDDAFRCEVSVTRRGLDDKGVVINGPEFQKAVTDRFHPHGSIGTPKDAPRTEGGSRVFLASCERLAAGVAHVAHEMVGENVLAIKVSVQNATGMVSYAWKVGQAPPVFPSIADRELTDRTYRERQAAIREGRSASNYC